MKKTLALFCLLFSLPGYSAGLYDDILPPKVPKPPQNTTVSNPVKIQQVSTNKERYKQLFKQCGNDVNCINAVYITELNQLRSVPYYPIYEPPTRNIHYGYNAAGSYVPTSIGEQQIHYGYNAYGEFVPMSIGD